MRPLPVKACLKAALGGEWAECEHWASASKMIAVACKPRDGVLMSAYYITPRDWYIERWIYNSLAHSAHGAAS